LEIGPGGTSNDWNFYMSFGVIAEALGAQGAMRMESFPSLRLQLFNCDPVKEGCSDGYGGGVRKDA
jgi:hypothetical protein